MVGMSETAIANGRLVKAGGFVGKFAVKLAPLWGVFGRAFETEVALRRPFLWLPVAAGTGVVLYLYADREPSLWLITPAALSLGVLAYLARANAGSCFSSFAGFARFLQENCRRPCGRRVSRRRSSTRSGSSRSKVLSSKWIFAATARGSSCGFIPPKGLRHGADAGTGARHDPPGAAFRGRHLCELQGAAAAARAREPSRRL